MIDPAKSRLPLSPEVQPSARPLLTVEVYSLLRGYLGVLEKYAREHSVPVGRVEVSGFQDPEEGTQQIIIAQWVSLPTKKAMEYWHNVGLAIEDWVNSLSDMERDNVAEWIAMEVYSGVDDAAA